MALLEFLRGATFATLIGCAIFFFRFAKRSNDRFFWWFSISFLLMAISQATVALIGDKSEISPYAYSIRLVAFGLIIGAIIDKNRPRGAKRD